MSSLEDRLDDLAGDAPYDGVPPADLWDRGVRRARARRAGALASVVAVVALVAGATTLGRTGPPEPLPAEVPFERLHLPATVNTPGTWSDEEGPAGPLAALGIALRTRPQGLLDERQSVAIFGVSAVDGQARWVDPPGVDVDAESLVGWYALSPDGRWLGWSRHGTTRRDGTVGPLVGWAVMDTVTEEVRNLSDPTVPRPGETMADLTFSGDSRYLVTSYEAPDAPATGGHQLVAFDVGTGAPTVLEEPGERWLPNPGSAPTGVVWSRGRRVHRADPATGARATYPLPQSVVAASWGPDGEAFAYVGRRPGPDPSRWRLYAGRSLADARGRALPLDVEPRQVLGWRDERHVVVGHFRTDVRVVDVVTGEYEILDLAGQGEPFNPPLLAADLWRNPLAEPAEPEGTSDPRAPYRWGGGALLLLAVGGLVLRRRRTRA